MVELNGWIALHRKFTEWGWYSDPATKAVFIHLLLVASWKDDNWRGIPVKRGQALIGRKSLAKTLGLSEKQVRTALKHLEDSGEITREYVKIKPHTGATQRATHWATHLTRVNINNYKAYQDIDNEQGATHWAEQGPHLNKDNNIYIKNTIYISELVDYLNAKTGKKYRQTQATKAAINGLMQAGYSIDDIKRVIDKKASDWMGTKYEAGLAPKSLFDADRFDGYLNESATVTKAGKDQLTSELVGLQIKYNEVGLTAEEQRRLQQLEEELYGARV